jgi:hypothetical protein
MRAETRSHGKGGLTVSPIFIAFLALALLATALAWAWLLIRIRSDAGAAAVAEEKIEAAEHRAAEAVKAQETRDAVARSSFDDAVDGL